MTDQGISEPINQRWLTTFLSKATPIQVASIVVFVILSMAIGIVGILMTSGTVQAAAGYKVLAVFVPITLASAIFAWLDNETVRLFATGLASILDVHKAALAAFIASGLAAIAVSLFVALSSLFADGPEDGVFALAAIEFLLKLAAVSAIIVLITLRRDPAAVSTGPPANGDAGKLEFGTIAFAFSLVIIAALIVPRDDLLRFGSMFFGGEKRLEEYLPNRPVAMVEQGLKKEISAAVVSSIANLDALKTLPMPVLQEQVGKLGLEQTIFSVLATNVLRQTERRGALPLLKSICQDTEDTLLFSNSDNRVIAEHLEFLASEGLVEYPYGDPRSISVTQYGNDVLKEYQGHHCPAKGLAAEAEGDPNAGPTTESGTSGLSLPALEGGVVRTTPYETRIRLTTIPTTFALELPKGEYLAVLIPEDSTDPVLGLANADGREIASDDDSGPGIAAALTITANGPTLLLSASALPGYGGWAALRITQTLVGHCNLSNDPSANLGGATTQEFGDVPIPQNCAAFSYKPAVSGQYEFSIEPTEAVAMRSALLVVDPQDRSKVTQVSISDDYLLSAQLEANRTYYLLVGYGEPASVPTNATVGVAKEQPADETPANSETVLPDDSGPAASGELPLPDGEEAPPDSAPTTPP